MFCKLPLIHRIACPRLAPGKCFSHDLGCCKGTIFESMLDYQYAYFLLGILPFLSFLAALSLSHIILFSALCTLSCTLNFFFLYFIFFPLPHLLFNLYFPAFLLPTSYLILCPSWIHLIISQHRRISGCSVFTLFSFL